MLLTVKYKLVMFKAFSRADTKLCNVKSNSQHGEAAFVKVSRFVLEKAKRRI